VSRFGVTLAGGLVGLVVLVAALVGGGLGGGPTTAGGSLRLGSVPAPYAGLVLAAGQICPEAPPEILAAQLEAESGWDPDARSSAGAIGIAQFMPGTWARWGRDANADGRSDPRDPDDAIPAQARYDCALVAELARAVRDKRVHGDLTELMLAAYNAGLGVVLAAGGVPPIQETRRYVARVLGRAAAFTAPATTAASPGGSSRTTGGTGLARPEGSPSDFVQRFLQVATSQLGVPYAWGGGSLAGPSEGLAEGAGTVGFDCSGLVRFAAYQASDGTVLLPRLADEQTRVGTPVPVDQLQLGDVVSFTRPGEVVAHHVGIYLGYHRMINAPGAGGRVRVESLDTAYWRGQRWRAVRYAA
jgi:cell wall-associated NlpC family hydrolase